MSFTTISFTLSNLHGPVDYTWILVVYIQHWINFKFSSGFCCSTQYFNFICHIINCEVYNFSFFWILRKFLLSLLLSFIFIAESLFVNFSKVVVFSFNFSDKLLGYVDVSLLSSNCYFQYDGLTVRVNNEL